jgi:hypothetical protein
MSALSELCNKNSHLNKIIFNYNIMVNKAHNAHYKTCEYGLIHINKNTTPNKNIIYHLYNDGEITYQKGSWAYTQHSEFTDKFPVIHSKYVKNKFKFALSSSLDDNLSYAILTKEECYKFRNEMMDIVNYIKMLEQKNKL